MNDTSYINVINSSRNLIMDIINLLESEHYNELYNPVVNNIINLINLQEGRFIQYINYERNRENTRRYNRNRNRNQNYSISNDSINNYRAQRRRENIEHVSEEIINILLSTNNDTAPPNLNILSPSQINVSTQIMKYSELDETIKTHQSRCPISYHDFSDDPEIILIKHCKHIFKKQSLLNWFRQSKLCPMCRYDLSTYREDNTYSSTSTTTTTTTTTTPNISTFSHLIYYQDIENQI